MYQRSDGNSSVQRQIEEMIFRELEKQFCIDDLALNPSLSLPDNPAVKIKPDFYSEAKKIIGEIHTHLGKLKPAQMHKVAADVLKLHLFDPKNQYSKYYVVCSTEEYAQLTGNSYLAEAIRQFGITVKYMELDTSIVEKLQDTMKKQNMFQEPQSEER